LNGGAPVALAGHRLLPSPVGTRLFDRKVGNGDVGNGDVLATPPLPTLGAAAVGGTAPTPRGSRDCADASATPKALAITAISAIRRISFSRIAKAAYMVKA